MDNKILTLCIALVVGVILAGSLLVPVLKDIATTEKTFTNEDYYFTMDKISASDAGTHTISWTAADNAKLLIDGVDIGPLWQRATTIYADDSNLIRWDYSTAGQSYFINIIGEASAAGIGYYTEIADSVTISVGTTTYINVNSNSEEYSVTSEYTTAYLINPNGTGKYIMKTADAGAYVNGDTPIYGMGLSTIADSWQNVFLITGNVDDGITATLVSKTLENDITLSDVTVTAPAVNGYKDLYTFEKAEFTATYGGVDYPLIYSYLIVPNEVTAEKSVHMDASVNSLIMTIPILVIVALLMVAVGAIAYRRAD